MSPQPASDPNVHQLSPHGMAMVPTEFKLEPRCRVCRNDTVRVKVNGMLSGGNSYASIVRALAEENAALSQCDRVTIDSVRNHTARHFPVQHVAKATYREILERRAQENAVDFVEGLGVAITPMALYESVMVKGYQALMETETVVDINTAMTAANRLQALVDARSSQGDITDIWVKMNRVIEAVRTVVPERMWGEILERLESPDAPLSDSRDSAELDVPVFDPLGGVDFEDDEDDF